MVGCQPPHHHFKVDAAAASVAALNPAGCPQPARDKAAHGSPLAEHLLTASMRTLAAKGAEETHATHS